MNPAYPPFPLRHCTSFTRPATNSTVRFWCLYTKRSPMLAFVDGTPSSRSTVSPGIKESQNHQSEGSQVSRASLARTREETLQQFLYAITTACPGWKGMCPFGRKDTTHPLFLRVCRAGLHSYQDSKHTSSCIGQRSPMSESAPA